MARRRKLTANCAPAAAIDNIVGLMQLQYEYARTGIGWDAYAAKREQMAARMGEAPASFRAHATIRTGHRQPRLHADNSSEGRPFTVGGTNRDQRGNEIVERFRAGLSDDGRRLGRATRHALISLFRQYLARPW